MHFSKINTFVEKIIQTLVQENFPIYTSIDSKNDIHLIKAVSQSE